MDKSSSKVIQTFISLSGINGLQVQVLGIFTMLRLFYSNIYKFYIHSINLNNGYKLIGENKRNYQFRVE